jgi:transposase
MEDRRCKLGLQGRLELVQRIESGATLRQAAACLGVAPGTAHRWWHRWREAGEADRESLACLRTRSSRPRSCPWALSVEQEQAILTARERTNYGPMQLQFLCGRHRSTIWKVLHRHGVSRQRRTERSAGTRRYEWAEAGALLHIDAFELPKFDRPGHWAHGDRGERYRTRRAGKVKVIGVIDEPDPPGLLRDPRRRERAHRLGHPAPRRGLVHRAGLRAAPGGDERQREVLRHQSRIPSRTRRAQRPPDPDPALHPTLEREDRTILRHA